MKRHRFAGQLYVVLLSAFITITASAATWPIPEPVQIRLDSALFMLDQLSSAMPETSEDVESLADELDYEFDAAVEFLQDKVQFEPYVGVLRGPEGVVSTRRGNAWDQALLLAALIRTMGGDAQIVLGELSEADARSLVDQSFDVLDQEANQFEPKSILEIVGEHDSELRASLGERIDAWNDDEVLQRLDDEVAGIEKELLGLLDNGAAGQLEEHSTDALIQAIARDYAWVRWRDGPSMEWTNIHPAYRETGPADVQPVTFVADEVPPKYQHRVSLRLDIERQTGAGRLERVPVMDTFERPVAQLYKNQISLGMGPLSPESSEDSNFIVPLLNDGIAPGGMAVSELGLMASAGDVNNAKADLFATLSEVMGGASSELAKASGGGNGGPRLTGVFLEVEITSPRAEPTIVDRRMVDLRDRPETVFPSSTAFGMVIDVDIGSGNETGVTRKLIEHEKALLKAVPALYAWARNEISFKQVSQLDEFSDLGHSVWPDFEMMSGAFQKDRTSSEMSFRPGPLLAARRTFTGIDGELMTSSDILFNPITVLSKSGDGSVVVDAGLALRQGVRETLLESELIASRTHWARRRPKFLVGGVSELEGTDEVANWPRLATEMAKQDLANGFVLGITEDDDPHWWRIDPVTGETLGMGTYGGQEIAEYIVGAITAGLSSYLFYLSVQSCDQRYANNREMADCCIVGNLAVTYGTAAISGGAGAASGAAGLPNGSAHAYSNHPWATSIGYVMATVGFNTSYDMTIGAAMTKPIRNACKAWVNR